MTNLIEPRTVGAVTEMRHILEDDQTRPAVRLKLCQQTRNLEKDFASRILESPSAPSLGEALARESAGKYINLGEFISGNGEFPNVLLNESGARKPVLEGS